MSKWRRLRLGLSFVVVAGCVVTPAPTPVRYEEDFSGDIVPYNIRLGMSDGQILVTLQPGDCRRIAISPGLPPRVVGEYPCRFTTANVHLGLILPNQSAIQTSTGVMGNAAFFIGDATALGFGAEDLGYLYVANQLVGPIALAPLLFSALSRASPTPPEPPTPQYTQEVPVQVRGPSRDPPPTRSEPTAAPARSWTPWEVYLLSAGVCAAKIAALQQCEKALNESLHLGGLAARFCNVGAQLIVDHQDLEKVADAFIDAEGMPQNLFVAAKMILQCSIKMHPVVNSLVQSGKVSF